MGPQPRRQRVRLADQSAGHARDAVERFFAASRTYYRKWFGDKTGLPVWSEARDRLLSDNRPLPETPLDIVTFGAPIRYGWETRGYSQLLHFVNHRPSGELPEYRAPFPVAPERVETAADGDFIHQIGVASTNFLPNVLSWRSLLADHRLHRLLQPGVRRRDLFERLRLGMRVADEGQTLLVDYGRPSGNVFSHLAGHGHYTQTRWMLFHAEEIARRFYAETGCP